MNSYQMNKAKRIAGVLVLAAAQSEAVPMTQLAQLAARMTESQWRTVSFQAGVPVADKAARIATVALLIGVC